MVDCIEAFWLLQVSKPLASPPSRPSLINDDGPRDVLAIRPPVLPMAQPVGARQWSQPQPSFSSVHAVLMAVVAR
ncbi:hypothetical protein E4U34_008120 [Claviceps purpurea]|nr:hypothetical protein E4U34_008120 [Claviceps purpurea]